MSKIIQQSVIFSLLLCTITAVSCKSYSVRRGDAALKVYRVTESKDGISFIDMKGNTIMCDETPLLENGKLLKAYTSTDMMNAYSVMIEMSTETAVQFGKVTMEHMGQQLALIYEGKLLIAARVMSPILDGKAMVTGSYSVDEAEALARWIRGE